MGQFNNYVTLKLPFYDPPTIPPTITLRHEWSQNLFSLLRYVTPDAYPTTLYHLFFFFEFEKKKQQTNKQRYAFTHDTSTHVFKQLNQIVSFKIKK